MATITVKLQASLFTFCEVDTDLVQAGSGRLQTLAYTGTLASSLVWLQQRLTTFSGLPLLCIPIYPALGLDGQLVVKTIGKLWLGPMLPFRQRCAIRSGNWLGILLAGEFCMGLNRCIANGNFFMIAIEYSHSEAHLISLLAMGPWQIVFEKFLLNWNHS